MLTVLIDYKAYIIYGLSCIPQTVSQMLFYFDIVRYYTVDTSTLLDSFNEFCLFLNAVYTSAANLINCKAWR